jgi:hypothetical protein
VAGVKLWERKLVMTESERAAAETLTGVWNGVFRQRLVGSVNFTATLSSREITSLDRRTSRAFNSFVRAERTWRPWLDIAKAALFRS